MSIYRDSLNCTPTENSFTPCVDILDEKNWLRAAMWLVAVSALIGNFIVLTFIITSRTKSPMTVTKFLICNLAFSDALQGIYLLTLATVDIKTLGEYFNYAQWWQQEGGCDGIGFLTVFASELSVYTLSVITLERWYAISHAIHLTKRVQMKQAVIIMLIGWIFAATMAVLPLLDVSSYQVTSICLPFRYEEVRDKVYICMLLGLNLAAFCVVLMCYVSIFIQVRGSNASMARDTYLARRMALLVFTDFICWGPVAIVAALSAGGVNIQESFLSDEDSLFIAKVILVIFYPFNACANPLLYAIATKQFQKDCKQTLGYCGVWQYKKRGTRQRLYDSRQNIVRQNSQLQSNASNATQLTSMQLETARGSIKSKSSVEALIASTIHGGLPGDTRRSSAASSRGYYIPVRNNKTCPSSHYHRKKKPGYRSSISCSASTIDSIESIRRPSDPVRVPETLQEADNNYDKQQEDGVNSVPPQWGTNKEQWHRDKWLLDERNKEYSEKSTDIDSGTEMNHISESECEDCLGLLHQNSITSSCSAEANLAIRQGSYSIRRQSVPAFTSCECDSQSECSGLTQYFPYKNCNSTKTHVENNNVGQDNHILDNRHQLKYCIDSVEEASIPLTSDLNT